MNTVWSSFVVFVLTATCARAAAMPSAASPPQASARAPLRFVENLGQWPEPIRFLAQRPGARVRVECDAIGLELFEGSAQAPGAGQYVRLRFEGASDEARIEALDPQPGTFSYFLGNDPARWRGGARSFAKLLVRGLYEGIDLLLRETPRGLEYDLVVAPGAELAQIQLIVEGAEIVLSDSGVFSVAGDSSELLHVPGRCFEVGPDGTQRDLECRWRLDEQNRLRVGAQRDASRVLVIDPELVWSTYLGGPSSDSAKSVAWGLDGTVTVVGQTTGFGFPATPGAFQHPGAQAVNVFVTSFSAAGELVYSSVFGGLGETLVTVEDVAVAVNGEAVVVGETTAADFPVTRGAWDTTKTSYQPGFVTRLSPAGNTLVYSSYLEGSQYPPAALRVTLDSRRRAIVGGAGTPDFPTTPGAYQSTPGGGSGDGFVTRLDTSGSTLEWSTLLGGNASENVSGLAVDALDRVTVVGITSSTNFPTTPGALKSTLGSANQNAFVCRLDSEGANLLWSTYLGGNTIGRRDYATGVALIDSGDVVVAGYTDSPTFPVTQGAFQTQPLFQAFSMGFVSRVRNGGGSLAYSTFLTDPNGGGACQDVSADPSGVVTVSGGGTVGFPTTPGAWNTHCNPSSDTVIVRLSPDLGRQFYSSFIGGPGQDGAPNMGTTPTGRVVLAGTSWVTSQSWPVTPDAYQPVYAGGPNDAVLTVIDLLLQGVRTSGASIPGCQGPLVANASKMPRAGSQSFSLYCSGAPPHAIGALVIAPASVLAPGGPTGIPGLPLLVAMLPARSNAEGFVEVPLPLPLQAQGAHFQARFVFQGTPACPAAGPFSTSNGLVITIQ